MFSKLLGQALLFLSGAGKDYKKLKKRMNEPEFKKRYKNIENRAKQLADEWQQMKKDMSI